MTLLTDYFTRAEFREVVGDLTSPYEYEDDDIDRAQDEAIRTLERWARTSWANVQPVGTGAITATDQTLVLSGATWAADIVGREVRVLGAGAAGADLLTTVATRTNDTTVELADAAGTTVSAANVYAEGDGTAAHYRLHTQAFQRVWGPQLTLERVPVVAPLGDVLATYDATVVDPVDIDLEADTATVTWGLAGYIVPVDIVTVAYRYGHGQADWDVKRPIIQASRSLLGTTEKRGKLPAGLRQYSTEGSTFVFGEEQLRGERPWPWDMDATNAIRAMWEEERPTSFIVA